MWPAGVVFYEVATAEVHSVAASNLKKQNAHIPRGCLLRRVAWDFQVTVQPCLRVTYVHMHQMLWQQPYLCLKCAGDIANHAGA